MRQAQNITIVVNDAGKNAGRFGVFHRRELICGLGDEIPTEYLEEQVTVRFQSGLALECLGKEVTQLALDRT